MNTIYRQVKNLISKQKSDAENIAWFNKRTALEISSINILYKEYQELKMAIAKNYNPALINDRKLVEQKLIVELNKYNIKIDDLKPKYSCKICKDTGFVGNKMCSCFKRIYSKLMVVNSGLKDIELPSFDNINFDMIKNIEQREKQKVLYKILKDYINGINKKTKNTILISGQVGVGKTYLLKCILSECIKKGYISYFSTMFNFNNDFIKYNFASFEEKDDIMNKYIECDVLLLDDLGAERIEKNTTIERIYQVLNERDLKNLTTIITTNLTLDEILNIYKERIFSRLVNTKSSIVINMEGTDLRLNKK